LFRFFPNLLLSKTVVSLVEDVGLVQTPGEVVP
jgi:hypothetical protein